MIRSKPDIDVISVSSRGLGMWYQRPLMIGIMIWGSVFVLRIRRPR